MTTAGDRQTRPLTRQFFLTAGFLFAIAAVVLVGAFAQLRLTALEAAQQTQASAYISALDRILDGSDPTTAGRVAEAYVATLAGKRLFACFELIDAAGSRVGRWPDTTCAVAGNGGLDLAIGGATQSMRVRARLDEGALTDDLVRDTVFFVLAVLLVGAVALLAIGSSYIRVVARPLASLRGSLRHASASAGRVASAPSAAAEFAEISDIFNAFLLRERELRRQEAFRRSVIDSAFDCVVTADSDGRIIEFNETAERTFGYGRVAVLGRPLVETIVPPDLWETHPLCVPRYLADGDRRRSGRRIETVGMRSDGTVIPVELSVALVELDGMTYITAYIRDISDRQRRERELEDLAQKERVAQARLIDAVESLSDGFVIYDADDRLAICNERYRQIYTESADLLVPGTSFEDIIRKGVERGQYPAAAGREEEWIAARLAVHRDPGEPIEQMLPNGRWLRIEERRTSDGGYVGFRVDITELKRREFELQAAKEDADRANAAKGDFLAMMSHEIRSPLNGVLGALHLLGETSLDGQQRAYMETSRQSGEALLAVINDVLDMSKIEAGRLDFERIDFDLHDVVEGVVALFGQQAIARGIELRTTMAAGAPRYLHGDPARLRQVLINLVGNAIKFTDAGSVTVACLKPVVHADEATVRLEVTDTGIGIAAESMGDLFREFTQLDKSYTRRHGGTGLGLAITRRLVEMMAGAIGVSSKVGEGSTFWVELPLPVRDGAGVDPGAASGTQLRAGGPGRRRILLAEDSGSNQFVFRNYLEAAGYTVDVASNGLEAVEAMRRFPYDLVLMDVSMPEMDGFAATARIRADGGPGATIPIVSLTAHAIAGFAERCRAAGMNDYLTKPIRKAALLEAVARWIGHTVAPAGVSPEAADGFIDRSLLDDLADGISSDAVAALLAGFDNEAAELVAAIAAAAGAGDMPALRWAAHQLKGVAGSFGAVRLAAEAREVERMAEVGDATNADALVPALERCAETTRAALAGWRRTDAAAG